jgi:hypothetical protein
MDTGNMAVHITNIDSKVVDCDLTMRRLLVSETLADEIASYTFMNLPTFTFLYNEESIEYILNMNRIISEIELHDSKPDGSE